MSGLLMQVYHSTATCHLSNSCLLPSVSFHTWSSSQLQTNAWGCMGEETSPWPAMIMMVTIMCVTFHSCLIPSIVDTFYCCYICITWNRHYLPLPLTKPSLPVLSSCYGPWKYLLFVEGERQDFLSATSLGWGFPSRHSCIRPCLQLDMSKVTIGYYPSHIVEWLPWWIPWGLQGANTT